MGNLVTLAQLEKYDARIKIYIDNRDGAIEDLTSLLGVPVNNLVDGINAINTTELNVKNSLVQLEEKINEIATANNLYIKVYENGVDLDKLPTEVTGVVADETYKVYVFTQFGEIVAGTNDGADTIDEDTTYVGKVVIPFDTFVQEGEIVKGTFTTTGDPGEEVTTFTEDVSGNDTALKLTLNNNESFYINIQALASKISFTDNEYITFTKQAEEITANIVAGAITTAKLKDRTEPNIASPYDGITSAKLDTEVTDKLESIGETKNKIDAIKDDITLEGTLHAPNKTVAQEITDAFGNIPVATINNDGFMGAEQKTKLDSIALNTTNNTIGIGGNTFNLDESVTDEEFDDFLDDLFGD